MKKEWYILVKEQEEGPYNLQELKNHPQINPNTFVKKKKWKKWIRIRFVLELRKVFKDPKTPEKEQLLTRSDALTPQSVLVLSDEHPVFPHFWWILLLICLFLFFYLTQR